MVLGVEAACFWLAGDQRHEVEVGNDIDELAAAALSAEGPVVTFGGDQPVLAISLREARL
jgi:hypothetical protein